MPTADHLDQYRRDIEDFNRGDLSRFGEQADENLVVHTVAGWPEEVFVGAPSYLNFIRQLLDPIDARIEVKELRQIGEVVAAQIVLKIRGHDTALDEQCEYADLEPSAAPTQSSPGRGPGDALSHHDGRGLHLQEAHQHRWPSAPS